MKISRINYFYWFVLYSSIFILSGCGFHLRGIPELPKWLNQVAIINKDVQPDLPILIKEQLQANGVTVIEEPQNAPYDLILQSEQISQQIVSVSSSTTPRQYQLTYNVFFKLLSAQGEEIIPLRKIVVTRQITLNSDRILGSDAEEAIIQKEMRETIARRILMQIK